MCPPPSRRSFLVSATTGIALTAGCSGNWFVDPDESASTSDSPTTEEYDCDDVSRPPADTTTADGALDPIDYPSRPTSLATGATQYATEFEQAYRRNALLEQYGDQSRVFEFSLADSQTSSVESDESAALASIVYDLTTGTDHTTHTEWDVRTTYYVTDDAVLRAQYDGFADDPTFDPDPRDSGELVACYD